MCFKTKLGRSDADDVAIDEMMLIYRHRIHFGAVSRGEIRYPNHVCLNLDLGMMAGGVGVVDLDLAVAASSNK